MIFLLMTMQTRCLQEEAQTLHDQVVQLENELSRNKIEVK
jgi:hypothetical protein